MRYLIRRGRRVYCLSQRYGARRIFSETLIETFQGVFTHKAQYCHLLLLPSVPALISV